MELMDFVTTSEDTTQDCGHFSHLPDELCARIFSYLHPVYDRVPVLALVCKKWRRILESTSQLWKTLNLDPSQYDVHHFRVLDVLVKHYGHHVQALIWNENAPVYESVFNLIPQLLNLRRLRLPVLWTAHILHRLSPLINLEQIDLNGGFEIHDRELVLMAKYFPQLKQVSLNACWSISSYGLDAMLNRLPSLQRLKLKINSALRLNDHRSERSVVEGERIVHYLSQSVFSPVLTVLCLHFVNIQQQELTDVITRLVNLRKLSISNCELLQGVRLDSDSIQKLYLFNIWSARLVDINAPNLRLVTIDHGMESMVHVGLNTPKLRRLQIDGSTILKTIHILSYKLTILELYHCDQLDMRTFRHLLEMNQAIVSLRLGRMSDEDMAFDESLIPNVQELCLLQDFTCRTLYIRSPTMRFFHTEGMGDLDFLHHIYVVANHLCKVSLVGIPNLKTLVIQCTSVDSIELNLCSDDQLCLESCVIQAFASIGMLRLFDCKVNMLSVSTPVAKTVVLYRCCLPDYVLKMALEGCRNIAYLNLELSRDFSQLALQAQPLKYLNLFGCADVMAVDVDCPELIAVNLGKCPSNVRFYFKGWKAKLSKKMLKPRFILPDEDIRWTHDIPPEEWRSN